jgi:ribosomal-protein-alanine N-acetyltransferase
MTQWQLKLTSVDPADIKPILEIERRSFSRPWNRISFLGELACEQAHSYVVKRSDGQEKEKVIGYIFFRLIEQQLHILKIAVTPNWRCRGIASRLLEQCIAQALEMGAESAFLEVRPSNEAAIRFYRKQGFRVIDRKPNYYADTREDALVLLKNLKEEV